MPRYSPWSPTTQSLPTPVKFVPKLSRPPKHGMPPLKEAPLTPGFWLVRLSVDYDLMVNEYRTARDINDDFNLGVSFYWRASVAGDWAIRILED